MQEVEARMIDADPEPIQKHTVVVNGRMFPPKQVLGHVTGWDRTTFTTMEAQRVLSRIGFDCLDARAERFRGLGQSVMDAARDSVQGAMTDHGDARFARGFSAAAGIALRQIQKRLNELREQMKGEGLSQAEQAFYAHLDELKAEIEADCGRFWRGSGVDWRPLQPVAKGVIRRTDETGS
ncbi:hypothetical protein [Blastococcus sp. LR1]|uniref:hypothetical protein n=1 Tax=Blastococcus sp. LR1 TaxID=2877000 RepID=UPI001CCB2793|nr:hypothetical protein [Blastococcus sp. LR1]MCA0143352.1 hypothetical protein [Blastococcus sp. LR1]